MSSPEASSPHASLEAATWAVRRGEGWGQVSPSLRRRSPVWLAGLVLAFLGGTPMGKAAAAAIAFNPAGADIAQLREALDGHRITYEQLVAYYLRRIAQLDQTGPGLHALISLNPEALVQARLLDRDKTN